MSEMHDRVTKAILLAFEHIPDPAYRKNIAGCWARAAIEAMREPTAEMALAPDVKEWPDDAKAAWRAMIDAALQRCP
jgi:hypothetical protein